MGALRKQSEELEAKVANLQKDMSVYSLGDSDSQGKPQIYSTVLDELQQQTTALSAAESNRIMKGALYQVVKSGNADLISGLGGSSIGGSSSGTNNSFNLIQTLRAQQATLTQQLAHDEAKYGSAYPAVAEEAASLQGINQSIDAEIGRLDARAKNDYEIAQQAEESTRADYERARQAADQLNDKSVEFTIARQEANDSRGLYQDLLKRLKEGGVLEGLRSSNITVVDPGRVPAKPKKPNVPVYLAVALFAGLFCGAGASLFIDAVDDKIQGVEQLEQLYGVTLLGIVPFAKPRRGGKELEAVIARFPFHGSGSRRAHRADVEQERCSTRSGPYNQPFAGRGQEYACQEPRSLAREARKKSFAGRGRPAKAKAAPNSPLRKGGWAKHNPCLQ